MADRLTQLQDCLDDILTQMYATLNYLQTRQPYGSIPGQPNQAPELASGVPKSQSQSQLDTQASEGPASQSQMMQASGDRSSTPPPEHPAAFSAAIRELAQGLVLKEQQMEILIGSLPGLGNNEADQEQRMRELQEELAVVEKEREEAEAKRYEMINELGDVIVGVGRIP